MKGLIIGGILGLIFGIMLISIDGWKFTKTFEGKGTIEKVHGGMDDKEIITIQYEIQNSKKIQILFKLGLLVTGLGLGIGIGSFFDLEVNNENNNT